MTDHPNPCLPGCSCPNAPVPGYAPDCVERTQCAVVGKPGHWQCGTCPEHGQPRHHCGCTLVDGKPITARVVPGRPELELADLPMAPRPIGMRIAEAEATSGTAATMEAAGRRYWADPAFQARVLRAVWSAEHDQPDDGFDRFHRDSLIAGAAMALHLADQEVVGYVIAERPVYGLHTGELVIDWDGKVHETREAADAELAVANAPDSDDATATPSDHWTLYELHPARRP